MEYAEQALSQILPHRALNADEVREMLLPTLDALAFLHRKNLVHGQLKPSNFLVVNDQLKLSSDSIRLAGESTIGVAQSSVYDPPEEKNGSISTAGDIWALGVTMVEALTQRPAAQPDDPSEAAGLPASVPAAFAATVRRCLSRNPAERPTVSELEAEIAGPPQTPVDTLPQPVARKATEQVIPPRKPPKQRVSVATIATLLIVLVIVWAGLRLVQVKPKPRQSASGSAEISSPQTAPAAPASQNPVSGANSTEPAPVPSRSVPAAPDRPAQAAADASSSVLHEEIPEVSHSANDTIRGHFKVGVRVKVDSSGNVVDETLEDPGPSKYFARLATAAAKKWKFARANKQDSREWLLWFEFSRDSATGYAENQTP
jgi:serine/threonine protein kinase